jgi:hypothetical protein
VGRHALPLPGGGGDKGVQTAGRARDESPVPPPHADEPRAPRPSHPQVAAPVALPGGMGVQIIDCAGAKLSMISSDTVAAFKVGSRVPDFRITTSSCWTACTLKGGL